ncbi:MAG: carbonic anhydrase [Candidatus Eremiobacteraeota bacterium]|nr:carbonic anhydrase [Candidatus Eremiobacteraeota bacterium]
MLTRDEFLLSGIGVAAGAAIRPQVAAAATTTPRMTSAEALLELRAGYRRYKTGRSTHMDYSEQRAETAAGQHPFAILLSCSDSRVPPETLFDQGIGSLFVIRLAGNVAGSIGIGSIEYGVATFACPLVVVLGHTNCGAVKAAVDALESNKTAPGEIEAIVQKITPAATRARHEVGDIYLNATKANAIATAAQLRTTGPIISAAVHEKRLTVVAALYSVKSGSVTIL